MPKLCRLRFWPSKAKSAKTQYSRYLPNNSRGSNPPPSANEKAAFLLADMRFWRSADVTRLCRGNFPKTPEKWRAK